MRILALLTASFFLSCGSDSVVTLGSTYFDQKLKQSGLALSVKYFCPVTDCYMAVVANGRLSYRDSKFRMPWRIKVWDSEKGAAILVCDQSAHNLFGYLRPPDGSFVDAKEAKDQLEAIIKDNNQRDVRDVLVKEFCGIVPIVQPELSRMGSIFLVEDGYERRLK